jgi:hypothetical protein
LMNSAVGGSLELIPTGVKDTNARAAGAGVADILGYRCARAA